MRTCIFGSVLAAVLGAASPAFAAEHVDVELVLAVDISRSMDIEELELQRAGYVAALRHPDFVRAVQSGPYGRIAVSYFEWAGSPRSETLLAWRVIDGPESAEAFAATLSQRPFSGYRGTSISGALTYATNLLTNNDLTAERSVIDISGDGPNNAGLPVAELRQTAIDAGIVINGLPILIRPSRNVAELDRYYAECVIGGPGAFMLPIRALEEFATAIRRKLVMEVSGSPAPAHVVPVQASSPVDCLSSERDRRRFDEPFYPELDR